MITQAPQPETAQANAIRIDGRRFYAVVADLCELSDRGLTRVDYFGQSLEIIAAYFGASVGLLNLRLGPRTLERVYSVDDNLTEGWTTAIDPLVLRAQTDETALARLYRNHGGANIAYALAAPIQTASGKSFGAVAFVINRQDFDQSEAELAQLVQLLELIVENAPAANNTKPSQSKSQSNALQSVVRASDYRSIHHLSFAIVNSLCSKFGCEQVALGLVRNRNIRLLSVSGMSEIPRNTPGMMAVQQAMATCLDRNKTTVVQQPGRITGQIESSKCKLHQFWHRLTGESCVATIPLRIEGRCVAVVSIRRKSSQPLVDEDIQRIQLLAESFAPAFPLVDRASRSLLRHVYESLTSTLTNLFTWNRVGPKLATACICLMMAWMMFGKTEYRVLAPCKIVPEQVYTVSVPHEGMISKVYVLPGQHVEEGDLLVQLDPNDLLIERRSILAEITSAKIEANALLQNRKHQSAFLRQSEIEVLETDLRLVEEQIRRSQIRAHQSGVVMPTEIHRRIGQFVALGEELLEIANENKWHLELEIPEGDTQYVAKQQQGWFQTGARPDQQLVCEITKISPSSQVLGQRNVVVAEALLLERDPWMKLGMEGHIRIETGRKPVWWVYLHPMFDYVRLKLWL